MQRKHVVEHVGPSLLVVLRPANDTGKSVCVLEQMVGAACKTVPSRTTPHLECFQLRVRGLQ